MVWIFVSVTRRIETAYTDEEDEVKTENGWDWLMVLSVVALGLIVWQISEAAMPSVFDEED
ncbi:MAG: hypothetical protein COA78_12795 [Blastopirellula sp.]|nr:MAG: hypothetical protein COA78_12795 [Blastopirellula sp.]